MPRAPRIHFPGAVYHATLRGNHREPIAFKDRDRLLLYGLLGEGVARFGHRIHGFCLMSNHLHLIIQVATVSLTRIIQNVSFRYTQWMNRQYRRVGHLFQGRYHADLIDSDDYLVQAVRYVHLNPVRTNLVADPAEYRWSSHRAYVGREALRWLTTSFVLGRFGTTDAIGNFEEFVRAGIEATVAQPTKSNVTVAVRNETSPRGGPDDAEVGFEKWSLESIAATVCAHYGLSSEALHGTNRTAALVHVRDVFIWIAVHGGATLADVARYLRRSVPAVSLSLGRGRNDAAADEDRRAVIARLRSRVAKVT